MQIERGKTMKSFAEWKHSLPQMAYSVSRRCYMGRYQGRAVVLAHGPEDAQTFAKAQERLNAWIAPFTD